MKPTYVKEHLFVFVKCTIDNPCFDSQTKEALTSAASKFGSKCDISDKFITNLAKTGIIEKVISLTEFKDANNLKKYCFLFTDLLLNMLFSFNLDIFKLI